MALIISYVFIFLGALFLLLAGVGMIRMPTFFMRMQATSKASTLGVILVLIGINISQPSLELAIKSLLISGIIVVTTPIATHAMALAAAKRNYDD